MKKYTRQIFIYSLLMWTGLLSSQTMEVTDATTPPITPENLITNIFLGDGVEVIDVSYEGDPLSVGYFKNGQDPVGIERGIILTSGRAASVNCNSGPFGADCEGTDFSNNDSNSSASDPDLSSIATGTVNDVAKYTITFIPTSDTLRFRYVFASEEYPEYSCTSFNDVFGFFISGPGITGPYQNNGDNIAIIPGTNLPVTINNIHPPNPPNCNTGAYDQFYNSNLVNQQPVYDGYLDVFTAEAVVVPCETYTIKLTVADVGDQAFDTGVFLEAKSFGTGSLQVETSTVSLDGTITEGCATGTISFTMPNEVEEDYFLDYTIIGTAVNGIDYETIDPNLFIAQGDSSLVVEIIGIVDDLDEGLESIGIDIQRDICNRDTFWIFIRDNEILPPQLGPDTAICLGDSVTGSIIDGTLPIPLPDPPTFTSTQSVDISDNAPTYSPILVAGVQPVTLGPGVIRSICINIEHKWVDDLDIFLITPGGQFIELSSDNGSNCDNYNQVCFSPNSGTRIDYGWPWSPCPSGGEPPFSGGEFLPEGIWEDLWDGDYPTNGTWQLLVVDDQTGFNGTLVDWTITFEPLYQLFYRWTPEDGLSCADCPDPTASPSETTTYVLTAWDTYGCEVSDSITVEVKDILPPPDVNCVNVTNNSITFEWNDVNGAMGYQVSINGAPYTNPNNGPLSHMVNGLVLSDTVTIEVFGISECDGEIGTATCITPDCNAPALTVDALQDVSCAGNTDGSIMASATGGAGNYTFQLDQENNTTGVFAGLEAGTYQLVVIDDWGCPNSIDITISEPDTLELYPVLINDISCFGADDGTATTDLSGGVYPYFFAWSGGQSDSIATGLSPGIHTVEVTDANSCSNTASLDIQEPPLLTLSTSTDSVTCFGMATGSAQVEIAGGTEPYLIQWDNAAGNATTSLVENLPAGTYSVQVEDLNGCIEITSATIDEPAGLSTGLSATNLSCPNSSDGTATVTVTGGVADYTYLWSNGDQTVTAMALDANIHFVTVTDASGCIAIDSIAISAPPPIVITLTPAHIACYGDSNGSVVTEVQGGTGPFGYLWDFGAGSADISGVPAGNYCLTVSDALGCSAVECIEILQEEELLLTSVATNAGCNGGSQGAIDLTVMGGVGPYVYSWSTGAQTEDVIGLTAGPYSVIVSDANGCIASLDESISETDAIAIQNGIDNVLCQGDNTGVIELTISGGSGSYNFTWSGPGNFSSNEEDLSNLYAGTYSVLVEDTDGCTAAESYTIDEPPSAVLINIGQPDPICHGAANGTATASATGGASGYTYTWSNGQGGTTLSDVPAGIYIVTVSDASGCTATEQVEIQQLEALIISLSQSAASCHNAQDGSATLESVTEGNNTVPLNEVQIQWSNGSLNEAVIDNLTGGQTYTVSITNNLGCSATQSITIDNPPAIGVSILSTENVSCFGGNDGMATVAGNGGTAPYSYLWSSNANSQQSAMAGNLSPGDYVVTVTDVEGCEISTELSIGQPPALALDFNNFKISCHGGTDGAATAIPAGGTAPYIFQWSSGSAEKTAEELTAGTYTLTLTDANGCTIEQSTEIIQPEEPLSADFTLSDISCPGLRDGMISIQATGGSPPYLYSTDGIDFHGSSELIALKAGIYDLFVKDVKGCTTEIRGIFLEEPEPFYVDIGADTLVAFGTRVIVKPIFENLDSNEIAELSYQWYSNNPNVPVNIPNGQLGDVYAESQTTLTLVVTDPDGCEAEDNKNIVVRVYRGVLVPTGFSPGQGGDQANDQLHVHGLSRLVEKISLFRVFDRWGELLYEAADFPINDTSIGWDGTFKGVDMPAGVYTWHVEVDYIDGISESFKGHTTLIR